MYHSYGCKCIKCVSGPIDEKQAVEPEPITLEEGDFCPVCAIGILEYSPVENCSCHINPPCSGCTDNNLKCLECGYEVFQ